MNRILITATLKGQVVTQHAAGQMGSVVIGRHGDCDIALENAGVSRSHAEISYSDEHFQLDDLGSSNGSFVNGVRVEHATLKDGDVVTIGKFDLHVSIPSAETVHHTSSPFESDPTIRPESRPD